ncbi:MAG: hypothetical protein FJ297_03490 [Planctomycetes bacterium]|nr:hypothetical protein [Planctomycetota bacterium]
MMRAFFLAIGMALVILGLECLIIERAVLHRTAAAAIPLSKDKAPSAETAKEVVVQPPEWVPWTFLSAGAVVILYSFTIPRRVNG